MFFLSTRDSGVSLHQCRRRLISKVSPEDSLSTLHEEVEVGSGELLMDGLQENILLLSTVQSSVLPPSSCCQARCSLRWRWLELRSVGEGEGRSVNHAVQSHQRQWDSDCLTQAAPTCGEDRDVRHDTNQSFRRPGENGEFGNNLLIITKQQGSDNRNLGTRIFYQETKGLKLTLEETLCIGSYLEEQLCSRNSNILDEGPLSL